MDGSEPFFRIPIGYGCGFAASVSGSNLQSVTMSNNFVFDLLSFQISIFANLSR